MRLVVAVAVVALAACPKDRTTGPGPVPTAADARVAPARLRPAATPMVVAALTPATLDWDRPVLTRMELEDQLDDGPDALAAARARLGRFVVSFRHGGFDPYDATAGRLTYRLHGLEGMDLDPPVAFVADPPVTVGSLPGPVGGSVRLYVSELPATITIDAAGAAALVAAEADDPITTQYLMELGEVGEVDGATVVSATLHGVRVVRLVAGEVFLDGRPAAPAVTP